MRIFITVLVILILSSCATTTNLPPATAVEANRSYTLSIATAMPSYYVDAIKKTVANSIPGEIDRVLVMPAADGHPATASGSSLVVIKVPTNLSLGAFVAILGHELGHYDSDIAALPTKVREIACDMWGLMAAIDLGYDPYERINYVRSRNAPETDVHPSDAERARRMLEVAHNYKK